MTTLQDSPGFLAPDDWHCAADQGEALVGVAGLLAGLSRMAWSSQQRSRRDLVAP